MAIFVWTTYNFPMAQISNNEIKFVRSLSSKKFRDESGMFIVEGEKMVREAMASRFEVVNVYRRDEIGEEAMSRISQLSSPSPVLAVVRKPSDIENGEATIGSGLYLALDSIRDPGNLGTILRIANWFGISALLASSDCVDLYNPKVIQASMGSAFRVDVQYCCLADRLREAARLGMPVYGTFLDGQNIYEASLSANGIIVMGNEGHGILPDTEALISRRLSIPAGAPPSMAPESLNVSAAAAVVCSEFFRRK